jgi:hypothetical protein
VRAFTETVDMYCESVAGEQIPAVHVPVRQLRPQAPQLFGSLAFTLMHPALQVDWPAGHWHWPPLETLAQIWPDTVQPVQVVPL